MDQNSSNGTDKRSWRERLGIGAGKDMPRIAEEFTPPAAPAATAARPSVKPAPMAPRPGVKAAPPRGSAAAAPSSAAGEKLAEKLKAQREAQERLAEQRVLAARQRAEVKMTDSNGNGSGKPKFTFAGDEPEAAKPLAPAAKAAVPPPPPPAAPTAGAASAKPSAPARQLTPPPSMTPPPMTPPRSPLGAERPVLPPRSPNPAPMPPPVVPSRPASRFTPPPSGFGSGAGYGAQVPPYRPMDPGARGYTGGYTPPPSYTPPPAGGGYTPPRLNVPASPAGSYGADAYGGGARNLRPPPRPAVGGYREEYHEPGDVFGEARVPRRATAGDYSQAYRDEQEYEEDLPPSRGPLLPLILLFLLALGAGLGLWWVYQSSVEKTAAGSQPGNAPVVEAPAQPAKVTPAPAPANNAPPKKLIYDRIVGDREVLGGEVINSEEVPSQPGDSINLQQPEPGAIDTGTPGGDTTQGQGGGLDDPVPLPLPPPPGDGGGDQQGSLVPRSDSNQPINMTAAGVSQAAESSYAGSAKSNQEGIISAQKSDSSALSSGQQTALSPTPDEAPSPASESEVSSAVPSSSSASASDSGTESISDSADTPPEPVKKKAAAAKKPVEQAEKSLGSSPVVLVPPAANAPPIVEGAAPPPVVRAPAQNASAGTADAGGSDGGIYGTETVAQVPSAPAAQVPATTAPKKKKTIADLFRNESNASDDGSIVTQEEPAPVQQQAAVQTRQVTTAPQPAPAPAPAPAPQQQASTGGGYVAQLASFANQSDASQEYSRLKARHGAALSGLTPIVTQAVVGGSTRYRLAVGVMQSREQASAVCAKLFAGGERDCLVRRQ